MDKSDLQFAVTLDRFNVPQTPDTATQTENTQLDRVMFLQYLKEAATQDVNRQSQEEPVKWGELRQMLVNAQFELTNLMDLCYFL